MYLYFYEIYNTIKIITLLPLAYIETIFCKKRYICNKMLKNQIIQAGPVPIKIAQFIINFKNIEYYNAKPAYLDVYDDLFNNVYKNKIENIENHTILNSGSICAIYRNNTDNTIIKRLHYKSIHSIHFYLSLIEYLFYVLNIPVDFNEFKRNFINQFSMNFESKMHTLFYNGLDNKLIKIPKIIDNNDEQIIMEYLPSRSFTKSNLSYFEAIKYSNILNIFFKHMILEHGIIHNDMHDGNWGVTDEGIVIYDFGYSTQLFDPNNIEEKELYSEVLLNSRFNEKKFISIINEKLTLPPIMNVEKIFKNTKIDFSTEHDIFQIIKVYIKYCKLHNHKLHINTYYLFSSLTIIRSIYNSIFQKYNINLSEKKITYKKLVMENAIIYTNPYYNNCKVWNKLLIDKFLNE